MRHPQTLRIAVPIDSLGPVAVDQRAQLRIGKAPPKRCFDLFPDLRDQQRGLECIGITVRRPVERFGGALPLPACNPESARRFSDKDVSAAEDCRAASCARMSSS